MDNETQQIFEKQLMKMPKEVVTFLSSASWDTDLEELGSMYNLSPEELSGLKKEVVLVLGGLMHPDMLIETLKKEVGLKGAILEALVLNIDKKILDHIRPALLSFFEEETGMKTEPEILLSDENKETIPSSQETVALAQNIPINPATETQTNPSPEEKTETFNSPFSAIIQPTPVRTWEKSPEVVPENLPTEETTQSFLPNLTPKTTKVEDIPAPAVATEPEGHPFEEKMKKVFTAGQQSIGDLTIEQAAETRKSPPVYHTDPYREPIE